VNRALTVQLVGGLGNQLFSYYACAAQAARLGVDLILDDTWAAHGNSIRMYDWSHAKVRVSFKSRTYAQAIKERSIRRLVRQVPSLGRALRYYEPQDPGHDEQLWSTEPGTTIRGYFQSWRLVKESYGRAAPDALRIHRPSDWLLAHCERAFTDQPIGVHVRRGDYKKSTSFGLVGPYFYNSALQHLREVGHSGPIWLFSDEPELAEKLIDGADIHVRSPLGAYEELFLMGKMAAFVTANSSFSWWGAWLSGSNAVVAPEPWFLGSEEPQTIVPPWWIRLPSSWVEPS